MLYIIIQFSEFRFVFLKLIFLQLEYGTIFCYGSNMVGRQESPCVFHIIPASESFLIFFLPFFAHISHFFIIVFLILVFCLPHNTCKWVFFLILFSLFLLIFPIFIFLLLVFSHNANLCVIIAFFHDTTENVSNFHN